jgi:hypothetical protein
MDSVKSMKESPRNCTLSHIGKPNRVAGQLLDNCVEERSHIGMCNRMAGPLLNNSVQERSVTF